MENALPASYLNQGDSTNTSPGKVGKEEEKEVEETGRFATGEEEVKAIVDDGDRYQRPIRHRELLATDV